MRILIVILMLFTTLATNASAQNYGHSSQHSGQSTRFKQDVISQGILTMGSSKYTYVAMRDLSTPMGFYLRVWLGPARIMIIRPDNVVNGTRVMRYVIYNTFYHQYDPKGNWKDQPRLWTLASKGVFHMPTDLGATVNIAATGRCQRTHVGVATRPQAKWVYYPLPWATVQFQPLLVSSTLMKQLRAHWSQQRWPRPNPAPYPDLTPVVTGRSPVHIYLRDHGKEDGDIVQLFVNGSYLGQIKLTNRGTTLSLPLQYGQRHTLKIKAMNEGSKGPNTAEISISGVTKGRSRQTWQLKTGQVAKMTIDVIRP